MALLSAFLSLSNNNKLETFRLKGLINLFLFYQKFPVAVTTNKRLVFNKDGRQGEKMERTRLGRTEPVTFQANNNGHKIYSFPTAVWFCTRLVAHFLNPLNQAHINDRWTDDAWSDDWFNRNSTNAYSLIVQQWLADVLSLVPIRSMASITDIDYRIG